MRVQAADTVIRMAAWPGDLPVVERLLRSYALHLASGTEGRAGICLSGLERELAAAAHCWSPPLGVLLLAHVAGEPAGCVALRRLPDPLQAACEMKRLWVEDAARGHGVGRALVEAAMTWCCQQGYAALLLDTVPAAMPQAVALYRSLGFLETDRYNANQVPGLLFLRKQLNQV